MTIEITYEQAIAELDEELDRVADEAHHWVVTECQLDEDGQHEAMQKVYAVLDRARATGMRHIDKFWGKVDVKDGSPIRTGWFNSPKMTH
jgi:hypothetical protein